MSRTTIQNTACMEHEPLFKKIRMESYWPTILRDVQQQINSLNWWQANSQPANQYFMYYCNSSCTKSNTGNFLSIFFKELWIDHLILKFHKSMFSQFYDQKGGACKKMANRHVQIPTMDFEEIVL